MKNDILVRFVNTSKRVTEIEQLVNDFLIHEKEGYLSTGSTGFSLVRKTNIESPALVYANFCEAEFRPLQNIDDLNGASSTIIKL